MSTRTVAVRYVLTRRLVEFYSIYNESALGWLAWIYTLIFPKHYM